MKAIFLAEQHPVVLYSPAGQQAEQDCACGTENLAPVTLWSPVHNHAETDCACPEHGLIPSSPQFTESGIRWQRPAHLYRAPLSETHEALFNPARPVSVAVLNRPARRLLDAFATPSVWTQATHRLPDLRLSDVRRSIQDFIALNLIQPATNGLSTEALPSPTYTSTTLSAWFHVTNACNLRCSYCYLHKSNEAMNEVTGRAAVEAVFRSAVRHGFQAVKLKYAGGEPTLNFALVRALHNHALALSDVNGLGLSEVLLSNGVALTPAILNDVRSAGMRLSISLDGIGAAHNAQRAFTDGQATFARVGRSIDLALAHGVRPYLSITVTAHNVEHLDDAVAFALDRELFFNLNFYRPYKEKSFPDNLAVKNERLIAGVCRAFAVVESRLPHYPLIGVLLDRATFGAPHDRACASGHSYLVIDQRGRVAHCQMTIDRPVTSVWSQDPLMAIRQPEDWFENVPVSERKDCHECPWRHWCAGGCPLLTYRATGQHNARSPYCQVYQALYPEMIRLESLRLLRWH